MSTESGEAATNCVPAPDGTGEDGSARSHRGSLRSKLVLSLAAMFLVFLKLNELVRHHVIAPEFIALERANTIRDANRVLAAMNSEVEHLADIARRELTKILPRPRTEAPYLGENQAGLGLAGIDWAAIVEKDGSWRWISGESTEQTAPAPLDVDNQCRELS